MFRPWRNKSALRPGGPIRLMNTAVVRDRHTSKPLAALILFVFFLISAVCLWLPVSAFWSMMSEFQNHQPIVNINKGVYYLFGVGIAFLALLVDGVNNAILRRKISQKLAKYISRIALGGMAVMVLLPALVHYPVADSLERVGYAICPEQSSQWLFVRTIVYALPGQCGHG